MLTALLGFDQDILARTSLQEQAGYRLAGWLFAAVCISMVAADAWFGHLFYGGWAAVLLSGHFLGYIHFAVYRLAMITLTTRPLSEAAEEPVIPAGIFSKVKSWLRPDAASLFRLVFISLIALAVSFPGASMFYHKEAETIQAQQQESIRTRLSETAGDKLYNPEARFPFLVFKTLWKKPGYRLLVLLWVIWIFVPLLLLTRLRHGSNMEYSRKVALQHRQLVERNFQISLLEAQQDLDARFPGKFILRDLILYEDPPFNTRFRNQKNRSFGDYRDFSVYLQSLSQG
jgi:hypothetical protein